MILLEQVRTLDRKRLRDYIGCLDKKTLQAVDRGLTVSLGIKQNRQEETEEDNRGKRPNTDAASEKA